MKNYVDWLEKKQNNNAVTSFSSPKKSISADSFLQEVEMAERKHASR
jgi:hypothetical protein